eukprot:scaffold2908_cov257-Pinguiococcus_pyrenoidosus.AAC.13
MGSQEDTEGERRERSRVARWPDASPCLRRLEAARRAILRQPLALLPDGRVGMMIGRGNFGVNVGRLHWQIT